MLPSGVMYAIQSKGEFYKGCFYNRKRGAWVDTFNADCLFMTEKELQSCMRRYSYLFTDQHVAYIEFSFVPTNNDDKGDISPADVFVGQERTIREDKHGPYVRHSNTVFRPQESAKTRYRFSDDAIAVTLETTWVSAGETLLVDKYGCVRSCKLTPDGELDKRIEQWYNHGAARVKFRNDAGHEEVETLPSHACWIPKLL